MHFYFYQRPLEPGEGRRVRAARHVTPHGHTRVTYRGGLGSHVCCLVVGCDGATEKGCVAPGLRVFVRSRRSRPDGARRRPPDRRKPPLNFK